MNRTYRPGDWLAVCDRTGFVVYASETVREWTGHIVRAQSFEEEHPQDFVRGVPDYQAVPFARPEATDVFLTANEVTREDL